MCDQSQLADTRLTTPLDQQSGSCRRVVYSKLATPLDSLARRAAIAHEFCRSTVFAVCSPWFAWAIILGIRRKTVTNVLQGNSRDVANNFLGLEFWHPGITIEGIVQRKFEG